MKKNSILLILFLILFADYNSIFPQTDDVIAIKNELNKWMKAYNQKDLMKSISIFADNYIGFYAGHPDQTLKDLKEQNEELFKNKFLQATLNMEATEIEISGDLAYLSIKQKWAFKPSNMNTAQIVLEKGILIMKKQGDGIWKIIRSSTFPVNARK